MVKAQYWTNLKFLFGRKILPHGRFNKFLIFSEQELKLPNDCVVAVIKE